MVGQLVKKVFFDKLKGACSTLLFSVIVIVPYACRMGEANFLRYEDTASANISPEYLRRYNSTMNTVKGNFSS